MIRNIHETLQRDTRCSTIVNVQNIRPSMTEDRLRKMFETYGAIRSFGIMLLNPRQHPEHENYRFAYVAFEDPDAAEEAIIELNGKEISDGERLRLQRTHKKYKYEPNFKKRNENPRTSESSSGGSRTATTSTRAARASSACRIDSKDFAVNTSTRNNLEQRPEIFVNNLGKSINSDGLRILFERYGNIRECKVIYHHAQSRGYGFVTFSHIIEATKAIAEMNGRKVSDERPLHVTMARGTNWVEISRNIGMSTFRSRQMSTARERFHSVDNLRRDFDFL